MNVKIIKPDTTLFEGTATMVQLPGINGKFELLENHAPIIAALGKGIVRIISEEGEKIFELKAGVLKAQQNEILVLVQ